MKFNFYQKVTITVFIVTLIAISIWFIPYRETIYTYDGKNYYSNKEIVFDSLFSNHYNIDLYRTIIILFITTSFFGAIILLTNKTNNPDFKSTNTKIIIKRELKYFVVFILLLVSSNIYCLYKNYQYNTAKRKIKKTEIKIADLEKSSDPNIYNKAQKEYFYEIMLQNFNLKNDTTPDMLIKSLTDTINKPNWDLIYKTMKNDFVFWHNINSPKGLKDTIYKLRFNEYESIKNSKIQEYNLEQQNLKLYISNNPYLLRKDFINNITNIGILGIFILYIVRLLIYISIKLKRYLKHES